MRRIFPLLLASLCVLVEARSAWSQKALPQSIRFDGDPEYSSDELMAAANLKLGEVMTIDDMNNVSKKLMATGVFGSLAFKFDGRDLIFTMTPSSELFAVRIDNLPITTGPKLDAELHQHLPLYHGKLPSEGTLLDDVRQGLEGILAAQGLKVSVAVAPFGDRKSRNKVTAMNFSIASPPVRLGQVEIQGASPALQPRLHTIITSAQDQPFSSSGTDSALAERIVTYYQNLGYAAVRVKVAQSGNAVASEDSIRVPELITIDEGKVYRVAGVQMPSGCLVTQDEANKIISSHDAQTPGENFANLLRQIDDRYKSKGYLDLVVTQHPQFDEAASTVTYTVEVTPGAVYRIGFVKFVDVNDELRNRLMRAWQLMPGDPIDLSYLDSFTLRAQSQDPALKKALSRALARYEMSANPVSHEVDLEIHLENH